MKQATRAALAALALLALAGCSVTIEPKVPLIPGQPTPGVLPDQQSQPSQPQPVPAQETHAQPVPEKTRTQPAPQKTRKALSPVAHFQHFNVRIVGATGDPDFYNLQAEVCLVDAVKGAPTRISTDPWSVRANGRSYTRKVNPEIGTVGNFPREAKYTEGECAYGWLSFPVNGLKVTKIKYSNSLGDVAVWDAGPGMERIR
jgi:hypothetical protein